MHLIAIEVLELQMMLNADMSHEKVKCVFYHVSFKIKLALCRLSGIGNEGRRKTLSG